MNNPNSLQNRIERAREKVAVQAEVPERIRVLSSYSWDNLLPIAMQVGIDADADPHMTKVALAREIYITETAHSLNDKTASPAPFTEANFPPAVYRMWINQTEEHLCLVFDDHEGVRIISSVNWGEILLLRDMVHRIKGYDMVTKA